MLKLATDADVHGDLIRGLRRRCPQIDLVRVQDVLPAGTHDVDVLEWAAAEKRVLVSNDRSTMTKYARERIARGSSVAGLIITSARQSIGSAIEDISLVAECMTHEEFEQPIILYLPLS